MYILFIYKFFMRNTNVSALAKTGVTAKKAKAEKLLVTFKKKDGLISVRKSTVKRMSELLGFNETDVVHYALSKLAKEIIPAYELDDGPLSNAEIKKIKQLSGIDQEMAMSSQLFG
jgi:hypothetical protein